MIHRSLAVMILAASLFTALGGCGKTTAPLSTPQALDTPDISEPPAAVTAVPEKVDIPGELMRDGAATAPAAGNAEAGRNYYNDYLRMTLTLEDSGAFTLLGPDGRLTGDWSLEPDGSLLLRSDAGTVSAAAEANGDLLLEGYAGYFLSDWDFWAITSEEAGLTVPAPEVISVPVDSGDVTDNLDGTLRYRVPDSGLAFTAPGDMEVLWSAVVGGIALSDGSGGYVTGRNVTELYRTGSGSDDEFMEDYVRAFISADFASLCGTPDSYEHVTLVHDNPAGRLAAVTLELRSGDTRVSVLSILYTSTFSDGTVNYIAKTVYAPVEESGGIQRLSEAVSNLCALRRSP